MFPEDTADFYKIFLHIKQIIRPSKSQPYIKKKRRKSLNPPDSLNTWQQKYR